MRTKANLELADEVHLFLQREHEPILIELFTRIEYTLRTSAAPSDGRATCYHPNGPDECDGCPHFQNPEKSPTCKWKSVVALSSGGGVAWELADCIGRYMGEPEYRRRLSFAAAEFVAKRGFGTSALPSDSRKAEPRTMQDALKQIVARTYSTDRRCRLDYEAVAEICDIATAALKLATKDTPHE